MKKIFVVGNKNCRNCKLLVNDMKTYGVDYTYVGYSNDSDIPILNKLESQHRITGFPTTFIVDSKFNAEVIIGYLKDLTICKIIELNKNN